MSETENYQFDARFTDNILMVGQIGCGKTTRSKPCWKQNVWENKNSRLGLENKTVRKKGRGYKTML